MKKKYCLLFLMLMLFFVQSSFAQSITVKGVVKSSEDGLPIPGVSVISSLENTSIGTITDFEGKYEIKAELNSVLVFSHVGFSAQEVLVKSNIINITLVAGESLNEVVVTALGINKERKSLGYAVQTVNANELIEGNQSNIVNGLQGKVAGVNIVNSGGAPGSSSIIMIRGGSSITGNNQPLFIIDGLPIDNSTSSSLEVASTNRASDINPEDIESISVLKGPAAAALYGIQAAGGAVIITTKKGKAGASELSYSGSVSIDQILGTPNLQTQYGQGKQTLTTTGTTIDTDSPLSWGNSTAGSPVFNNLEDFFSPAISSNHNLSYSGGSAKSNVYFSIGDISQDGVIKSTSYDKTSFRMNASSEIYKNLIVGMSANYINTKTNSTKQGNAIGGSFLSLLGYPANVDASNYLNADNSQHSFFLDQQFDNPYWSIANSPNTDEVNRLLGMVSLTYNFLNDFNLSYKLGIDNYTQFNRKITGDGSLVENKEDGYISQFEADHKLLNSNLMLSFQKQLTKDFSVEAMMGNSVEELDNRRTYATGDGFQAPGIYSIGNVRIENQSINEVIKRKRMVGVFGEVKLSWQNALFLTATGRNDWSSTLPKEKRSFFYPSVGMSALVTDLFKKAGTDITSSNGLSYLQLRSTWAKVGRDAPIGALESSLSTNINPLASSAYVWNGIDVGNPNLEPEFTTSFEIGFDARFFENRIALDLTYYTSTSENQILRDIRVPPTTGTFFATLNGGSISNSGLEALLSVKVLAESSKFKWDVDLNFGMNNSKVNELPGFLNEVYLSNSWTFNATAAGAAILDGSLFGLRGYRPLKNDNGDVVINSNGLPTLVVETYTDVNRMPDWTLGISNAFSYSNFRLSFLLDMVQGVDVYNATESALVYYGLSPQTTNRNETIVLPGVDANGAVNTVPVIMDQAFYQNYYYKNTENFIEDGSYARLRYLTLSYKLPGSLLKKALISSIEVYASGKNLFTITNYSGVDPEVNTFGAGIAGAGSMSIDNLGTPNVKGFDLGLKVRF